MYDFDSLQDNPKKPTEYELDKNYKWEKKKKSRVQSYKSKEVK